MSEEKKDVVYSVRVERKHGAYRDVLHYFLKAGSYSEAGSMAVAGACHGWAEWLDEDKTSACDTTGAEYTWEDTTLVTRNDVPVIDQYMPIFSREDGEEWVAKVKPYREPQTQPAQQTPTEDNTNG
jgi:hypothetical protein